MSILTALLPKSFLTWVESEARSRCERLLGLTDRELDFAEKRLAAQHRHAGIKPAKVVAIENVENDD